ncbi:MAG TPA: biosynthetic-type acetolactate synthase large subunit [Candidatus Copromonas faecavium]|uniref:Acetolactate synthase n=1 Tax=Candidatus Copromonas faecavium (nom. illeg.) TaxID=2840740 RepID=A0A9D1D5K3_9FIRM|nr:biosynthetic-type acetolactate synthase large subunit [Candidatus Copromonas faecavium]
MKMNGARILVEELIHQGVEVIFGYPGGSVLNIYDELYLASDRIKHVLAAHEQGAAHAADGYARASKKTGVVLATSGPGATNLVTGIANAYLDSVPMVAITGNVAVENLGKDSFQEVDIVGVTQPIVKHNYMVRDVKDLQKTIIEAFEIANSGRKGPVLIDIPKNVQIDECEYVEDMKVPSVVKKYKSSNEERIRQVAEMLKEAKRPFIYAGGGVLSSGAEDEVLELSRRLDAPVGLSMMGMTAVPHSYPLNLGMCGMHGKYASIKAQSECDLMIGVGVRFSDRATGDLDEYTKKCMTVHIDIDRAEIGKNVNPDVSMWGDVKEILKELLAVVPQYHHPEWVSQIEEYKNAEVLPKQKEFGPRPIIEEVNKHCGPDTVVATDVGQHQMWTMQYYHFEKPRTLLTSGGLGTMGYGLGAAIGGCIACGGRRTVLFTGDGCFGMNLNEMATAVSQWLPITIVIFNNNVLGMVRQWQTIFYDGHYSQTTLDRQTDFPALAKAFGAEGYSAFTISDLQAALDAADQSDGPVLIDCHIDMDEKVLPMIPPGRSAKDMIVKG